ncbi:MAG: rhodanese-like domain-containing protein [Chromatiales bacterium]|nr:rhodanese-like domain-containing protein [Chromatiales bacterium]
MSKTLSDFISEARARVTDIQADDLEELREETAELLLVDVREPYEYEKAHIPGAILVPRGMLEGAADPNNAHRIEALYTARDKPVVIYCETGARAAMAVDTLQQMGFANVKNLAGGIKMWEAEDLDIESGTYDGPLP